MKFLADESCDFSIVRALRESGHHVIAISEENPGLSDEDVIDCSTREQSILLTEDKDFGQLAHAAGIAGIVLFRFPAGSRATMSRSILNLIEMRAKDLHRTAPSNNSRAALRIEV